MRCDIRKRSALVCWFAVLLPVAFLAMSTASRARRCGAGGAEIGGAERSARAART